MFGKVVALVGLAAVGLCPNLVPEFRQEASNGVVMTEMSLTERPVIVVFLKDGCPANPGAAVVLNDLQGQLGESVQIVGFLNADLASAKALVDAHELKFPVIPDAELKVTDGFGAESSLRFTIVATKQEARWPILWDGLSNENLQAGIEVIRRHGHEVPEVNLSAMGQRVLRGCMF